MSGSRFSSGLRFCKKLSSIIQQNRFSSLSSPNSFTYSFNSSIQIGCRCFSYYGFDKSLNGVSSKCPAYYLSLRSCSSGKISVDEILNLEQKDVVRKGVLMCEADRVYKTITEHASGDFDMEKVLDQASIPLSTDLVAEILQRLHYEEKIAFRFFMWSGSQENYHHEPQVYNEMIDILSSTKYKVKQFRIVCDTLDYMKRNDKKSVPVEDLLKILRKYTEKYLPMFRSSQRRRG